MGNEQGNPKLNGEKTVDRDAGGKFIEGNPGGGRPKGSYSIVTLIKKKAQELYPSDTDKQKTYGDKVVEEMFKRALADSDLSAIKDIVDRIDGKAVQKNEVSTPDGIKVVIEHIGGRGKDEGDACISGD